MFLISETFQGSLKECAKSSQKLFLNLLLQALAQCPLTFLWSLFGDMNVSVFLLINLLISKTNNLFSIWFRRHVSTFSAQLTLSKKNILIKAFFSVTSFKYPQAKRKSQRNNFSNLTMNVLIIQKACAKNLYDFSKNTMLNILKRKWTLCYSMTPLDTSSKFRDSFLCQEVQHFQQAQADQESNHSLASPPSFQANKFSRYN